MSEPPPLPLEIYYRILTHVTQQKDLFAFSLCCRAFRDEAQRQLFRDPFNSAFTYIQQVAFLDAIIASPLRLGLMVKSCTITQLSEDQANIERVRNAAAAALPLMCNLTTLKMDGEKSIDVKTLLGCSFQLDVLVVGVFSHWNQTRIEFWIFDYLRTQPSLRHLTIHYLYDREEDTLPQFLRDDTAWCPNLVSLSVEEALAGIFLAKHRPIKHLTWDSSSVSDSPLHSTYVSSMEYLSCSRYTLMRESSRLALRMMTSLVLLDVYIKKADAYYFLEQDIPRLRFLIVAGFVDIFASRPRADSVLAVFKLYPALERIDMSMTRSLYWDFATFDRYYPPDAHGEMDKSVVQRSDVYAWKSIV